MLTSLKRLRFCIGTMKKSFRELRTGAIVVERFPGTTLEKNVQIKGRLENLALGVNVVIQSGVVLHLGGMPWCQGSGLIAIGDGSVISPNCVIYGGGPGGVKIGKKFDCGPNVGIFASRTDYEKGPEYHIFEQVRIGDEVTIFANSVISPGAKIGDGAVIAAGSVVINDVPPKTLVGGVPAKVIRQINRG